MSFSVEAIRDAWALSASKYRRPHCLSFFVQATPTGSGVVVAVQADTSQQQTALVEILLRVSSGQLHVPRLLRAAEQLAPTSCVDSDNSALVKVSHDNGSLVAEAAAAQLTTSAPSVSGGGEALAPSVPGKGLPKGAGKGGRGKGPPPPPQPKAGAKAKAVAGGVSRPRPPLGRVLTVRPLDRSVALEHTVFGAMLSNQSGSEDVKDNSEDPRENSEDSDSSVAGALREAFSSHNPGEAKRFEAARRQRVAKTVVIDSRTAQNAEIILRRLPISVEALRCALERLDFEMPLNAEELERLRFNLPSPEQLRPLQEFKGDTSKLRGIEQKLFLLSSVERMGPRLHVLALKKSLLLRRQTLLEEISRVRCACSELMESRVLRDVLEAVLRMFNFVNHGVDRLERGTVRGFDITSAMRVAEFKAATNGGSSSVPFPNFTGLHFVVTQVLQKRPYVSWRDLSNELKSLSAGSGLNIRCIARDASDLHEEARFLERELGEHRACYEGKPAVEESPPLNDSTEAIQPLLSPVPELNTVRQPLPSPPQVSVRQPVVQQLPSPNRLLTCFAPKGASLLCEELPSQLLRWRCVRIGRGGSLEVHSKSKTRTMSLQGAVVRPLNASTACSGNAEQHTLGVEVANDEVVLRFLCSTEDEVERWLGLLLSEAKSAAAGWLMVMKAAPGLPLPRAKLKRWWCVFDGDNREMKYYRSAMAARRMGALPVGRITVTGGGGLRGLSSIGTLRAADLAALSRGATGTSPTIASCGTDADEAVLENRCFTIKSRRGNQYVLLAQSALAREAWLRTIQPKGSSARLAPVSPIEPHCGIESESSRNSRLASKDSSMGVTQSTKPELPSAPRGRHGRSGGNTSDSSSCASSSVPATVTTMHRQPAGFSESDSDSESDFGSSSGDSTSAGEGGGTSSESCPIVRPRSAVVAKAPPPILPTLNLAALSKRRSGGKPPRKFQVDADAASDSMSSISFIHAPKRNQHGKGLAAQELPVISPRSSGARSKSVATTEDSLVSSAGDSDGQDDMDEVVPTARLPLVQKIERLKDTAALAELEINSAVREACQQAAQTMRYFGQASPNQVVLDPEILAPFALNLQQFLQSVDRFIKQVNHAWREVEIRQQERRNGGLGELCLKTPRTWVPLTARGERPRGGVLLTTPRTPRESACRTPRHRFSSPATFPEKGSPGKTAAREDAEERRARASMV